MFVELVYDKRNFDGLPSARDITGQSSNSPVRASLMMYT